MKFPNDDEFTDPKLVTEVPKLPESIMALELLQMIYRGAIKLSQQQIRAAIGSFAV
jgi:hypothetical protein